MSLNAYKISLKFYTSYLNNNLQQIIHSYISLLKYHRKILRTWREVPRPKACYRKPRHLIEAHHQTIPLIVNFNSDSHAKFFNAISFAKLKRSSNSQ